MASLAAVEMLPRQGLPKMADTHKLEKKSLQKSGAKRSTFVDDGFLRLYACRLPNPGAIRGIPFCWPVGTYDRPKSPA